MDRKINFITKDYNNNIYGFEHKPVKHITHKGNVVWLPRSKDYKYEYYIKLNVDDISFNIDKLNCDTIYNANELLINN